mmetsp:Transcript_10328/g.41812  ORF Transcript_10328/g.41812 Transcript_10328/m.41812 type:complete len:385 (+) Transcript_10328:57-1211(+)
MPTGSSQARACRRPRLTLRRAVVSLERGVDFHVAQADLRVVVVLLGEAAGLLFLVVDLVDFGLEVLDVDVACRRRIVVVVVRWAARRSSWGSGVASRGDVLGPALGRVRGRPVPRGRVAFAALDDGRRRADRTRPRPPLSLIAQPRRALAQLVAALLESDRVGGLVVVERLAVVGEGVLEVLAVLDVLRALELAEPRALAVEVIQRRRVALDCGGPVGLREEEVLAGAEVGFGAVPVEEVDAELPPAEARFRVVGVVLDGFVEELPGVVEGAAPAQQQGLVEQQRHGGLAARRVLAEVVIVRIHRRVLGLDEVEQPHPLAPHDLGAPQPALLVKRRAAVLELRRELELEVHGHRHGVALLRFVHVVDAELDAEARGTRLGGVVV